MSGIDALIRSWDDQQAAYITHREQRFGIALDAIARYLDGTGAAGGEGVTVVDLACGPGSLSQRILDRFPSISVVGVDYDPVLLTIAKEVGEERYPGRFLAVDADLAGDWRGALPTGRIDIAVSSTALHWLHPHQLVALYAQLAEVLPEGGIFLDADHLRYDPQAQPFLTAAAAHDDERTQAEAYAQGVLTWDQWWEQAVAIPELAALAAERERRFADRPPTPHAPLELHLSALRTAGFRETGVVWRFWDDVVILGRR